MTLKRSGALVETISFGCRKAGIPSFVSAISNACRPTGEKQGMKVNKPKVNKSKQRCGMLSFWFPIRNSPACYFHKHYLWRGTRSLWSKVKKLERFNIKTKTKTKNPKQTKGKKNRFSVTGVSAMVPPALCGKRSFLLLVHQRVMPQIGWK